MHSFRSITGCLTLVLLMGMSVMTTGPLPFVLAQDISETQTAPETIELKTGEVFEIVAIADDGTDPSFSWVLTQGQEFLEAGPSRIFRFRPTDLGDYTLEGAVYLQSQSVRIRKTITLHVIDRVPGDVPEAPAGFLQTSPSVQNGNISLARNRDILTLIPGRDTQGDMRLDLNTNEDTNGDGDPSNDADTTDTLFTREGNALRVWFATTRERRMRVADDTHATPLTVRKTSADAVNAQPTEQAPRGQITTLIIDGNFVRFMYPVDTDANNLVYVWDFGDGAQSLLHTPSHTYTRTGMFTVRVEVRALRDGQVLSQGQSTVTISTLGTTEAGSSSSSQAAEPEPEPEPEPAPSASGGSGSLGLILRILALGLGAIAIGAVLTWLGSKVIHRGRRLQKSLEDAEAKLLGKDAPSESIDVPPPPLELKRADAEPAASTATEPDFALEIPKDEEPALPQNDVAPVQPPATDAASSVTPPPQDFVDTTNAPSWLKQGLVAQADATTSPAAAPAEPAPEPAPAPMPEPVPASTPEPVPPEPAPVPKPVAPAPAAQPEPQPEPMPAPIAEPTPVPMPEPVAPIEPAPTPEPEPAPIAEPAPALAPAPMPAPEPAPVDTPAAPAPAHEELPPWLRPEATAQTVPEIPAATAQEPAPEPLPQVTAAPATTDAERERAEKERERKRRKRQRYRENLKKRKEAAPAQSATPTPTPPIPEQPVSEPATQPPMPESAPDPIPSTAPTSAPEPAPAPATTAPIEPAPPAPAASPDDVAFMIRAESAETPLPKPEDTPGNPA